MFSFSFSTLWIFIIRLSCSQWRLQNDILRVQKTAPKRTWWRGKHDILQLIRAVHQKEQRLFDSRSLGATNLDGNNDEVFHHGRSNKKKSQNSQQGFCWRWEVNNILASWHSIYSNALNGNATHRNWTTPRCWFMQGTNYFPWANNSTSSLVICCSHISRWWFQPFFICTLPGEMIQFD